MNAKHARSTWLVTASVLITVVLAFAWYIASRPVVTQEQVDEAPIQASPSNAPPVRITPEPAQSELTSDEPGTLDAVSEQQSVRDEVGSVMEDVSPIDDRQPLSYEEELRQRFLRISRTPEFQAVNRRMNELNRAFYDLHPPDELRGEWNLYQQNPYHFFGATREEALQLEWSEEDLEFIREEGERLNAALDGYRIQQEANSRERKALHQQRLDLLDMTEREFKIALGRSPGP